MADQSVLVVQVESQSHFVPAGPAESERCSCCRGGIGDPLGKDVVECGGALGWPADRRGREPFEDCNAWKKLGVDVMVMEEPPSPWRERRPEGGTTSWARLEAGVLPARRSTGQGMEPGDRSRVSPTIHPPAPISCPKINPKVGASEASRGRDGIPSARP